MDDSDMEESKSNKHQAKKNGTSRRDPLEKEKKAKSKDQVAPSKLANKRSQKEAIKKNKMKLKSVNEVKDLLSQLNQGS